MPTMHTLRILTPAFLLFVLATPAHAINLSTCTTAEECGIVAAPTEVFAPTGGVSGIGSGDLIKLVNDNDPSTHEDEAVYYLDKDWRRRPFPNQAVYKSWYTDFSGVKSLTKEQMSQFRLGKSVVYRPGTRLVKIPSVPKVYAVEPNGSLRWIESEEVAITLFGTDWNKLVDDVSEVFFTDYREGVPLAAAVWPTGTVVRRQEDGQLFLVDGYARRLLTDASLSTMHLNVAHAITAPASVVDTYVDIGNIPAGERRFMDTAQQDFLETLPPPHFSIGEAATQIDASGEVTLARLRVVVGAPIILRRLGVTVTGPSVHRMHLIDSAGNDLFGMRVEATTDGAATTFSFNGAYTVEDAGVGFVELRATPVVPLSSGAALVTMFDRASMIVADGGNGNVLPRFTPSAPFAEITATVR